MHRCDSSCAQTRVLLGEGLKLRSTTLECGEGQGNLVYGGDISGESWVSGLDFCVVDGFGILFFLLYRFAFFFLNSIFAYGLMPWQSPAPRRGPSCPVHRHIELI